MDAILSADRNLPDPEKRTDEKLARFIVCYYFLQAVNLLVKIPGIPIPGWSVIPKAILALMLVMAVPGIWRRARTTAVLTELTVLSIFIFTFIRGETEGVDAVSIAMDSLTVFLPMGICAYAIQDDGALLRMFRKWTPYTHIVLYLLSWVLFRQTDAANYNMSVGYAILRQQMFIIDRIFEKPRVTDLAVAFVDLVLILLLGSRGPLICLAVFLVLHFLHLGRTFKQHIFIVMTGAVVMIVIYLFGDTLLQIVARWLTGLLGDGSRTLRMLSSGKITYLSGRERLINIALQHIHEKPLFGWGVCGGWIDGAYPHNIFIEILLSFGIPFGIFAIGLLLYAILRGFWRQRGITRRLFIIFFSYMMELLFSGSFAMASALYIFLFLCFKRSSEGGEAEEVRS